MRSLTNGGPVSIYRNLIVGWYSRGLTADVAQMAVQESSFEMRYLKSDVVDICRRKRYQSSDSRQAQSSCRKGCPIEEARLSHKCSCSLLNNRL